MGPLSPCTRRRHHNSPLMHPRWIARICPPASGSGRPMAIATLWDRVVCHPPLDLQQGCSCGPQPPRQHRETRGGARPGRRVAPRGNRARALCRQAVVVGQSHRATGAREATRSCRLVAGEEATWEREREGGSRSTWVRLRERQRDGGPRGGGSGGEEAAWEWERWFYAAIEGGMERTCIWNLGFHIIYWHLTFWLNGLWVGSTTINRDGSSKNASEAVPRLTGFKRWLFSNHLSKLILQDGWLWPPQLIKITASVNPRH